MTKITIILAIMSAFLLGGNLATMGDHKAAKVKYIDHRIYQPIRGDQGFILAQRDLLAAAIPEYLLKPMVRK